MAFENDEQRAERELEVLMNDSTTDEQVPELDGQEAPVVGEVETPPATETQPKQDEETYRQRYQTLQGMIRAEREKWQGIEAQYLQTIAELKTAPPAQNELIEVDDNYRSAHVTDATRQSLAYRRMAELNGQRHTEIHFESLAMMAPRVEERQEAPVNGTFFMNLDRLAAGWREMNQDPNFIRFLSQIAPYSGGMTLQDKLDEAVQRQDAAGAAQFFIDFSESNIQPTTTRTVPDALLAPPRRGSNTHIAAEAHQGKVYTKSEWDAGWRQLELGSLSAKMAADLEADLTSAPGQGRVVG